MLKILFVICNKINSSIVEIYPQFFVFIILKTHRRFHMVYTTFLKLSLFNPAFFRSGSIIEGTRMFQEARRLRDTRLLCTTNQLL